MAVSIFDIFKIGIGPSSSHTVGPLKAARRFAFLLDSQGLLKRVATIHAELFGSLGLTGRGHGTDKAVVLGLSGESAESVDTASINPRMDALEKSGQLRVLGKHPISFQRRTHLRFHKRACLPHHSNGMRFIAKSATGDELIRRDYYSVGGGFIVNADEAAEDRIVADTTALRHPFSSCDELLDICRTQEMSIANVMLQNERAWRSEDEISYALTTLWQAMQDCVNQGCRTRGELPGGLHVSRRAPQLYRRLTQQAPPRELAALDWVNMYALAVNEENAAGGRVVTAPTNGAAGIIPALLHYYRFHCDGNDARVAVFLLTAGAIGLLFKENASISGAEVGCQGEVGVACSMAAGGLAAALGASIEQVENAAEIGMEHNLGLTCDPIAGLVQIPCIERNAMGAVKAINAQRMAMQGDGKHRVSLDKVIKTMRDTGRDMLTKYKETSRGGLAVNVIEC